MTPRIRLLDRKPSYRWVTKLELWAPVACDVMDSQANHQTGVRKRQTLKEIYCSPCPGTSYSLFGVRSRRRYHARNKSTRKTTENLARQQQAMDRAIVGGSGEVNGGLFTIEEDCPRCSQTSYRWGGLKNRACDKDEARNLHSHTLHCYTATHSFDQVVSRGSLRRHTPRTCRVFTSVFVLRPAASQRWWPWNRPRSVSVSAYPSALAYRTVPALVRNIIPRRLQPYEQTAFQNWEIKHRVGLLCRNRRCHPKHYGQNCIVNKAFIAVNKMWKYNLTHSWKPIFAHIFSRLWQRQLICIMCVVLH